VWEGGWATNTIIDVGAGDGDEVGGGLKKLAEFWTAKEDEGVAE